MACTNECYINYEFLRCCPIHEEVYLSFLLIVLILCKVADLGRSFHWGREHGKAPKLLKDKISHALVLVFPNLQQLFEVEGDASEYAMCKEVSPFVII